MALSYSFLTELYKNIPAEELVLLKELGKRKEYSPLPEVRIRIENAAATVASLAKRGDPARPISAGGNVTEVSYTPPEIFEYAEITEDDVFNIVNPEIVGISSSNDVLSNAEYLATKSVETLKKRADRRKELMLAQLVSEGKITYNDGVRSLEFDFGVTPQTYTLSSTTGVVSDLMDLVDEMKTGGANPDLIFITPNVEKAMLDNSQFQNWVKKNAFDAGEFRMKNYKNSRVAFILNGVDAPFVVYLGRYVDESGNAKNYIDYSGTSGKIILVDSSLFRLGFGAIVNYKIKNNGSPIRGEAVLWEDVINNGAGKAVFLQSRPLPYIVNTNAIKILDVTIA